MEGNKNLIYEPNLPEVRDGSRMLLSFSDSWNVDSISTIVSSLVKDQLSAERVARISREGFYNTFFSRRSIHGEPYVQIKEGVLAGYSAGNDFYYAQNAHLLIFQGAEPDMNVDGYCDCLFEVAERFKVREMYFGGSLLHPFFPPTREPFVLSFVSDESLKEQLRSCDIKLAQIYTNHPCSIVEYLMYRSRDFNIKAAAALVAIPPTNIIFFPSALTLGTTLEKLLHLNLDLSDLKDKAKEVKKFTEATLMEDTEMRERTAKLEEMYDMAMTTDPSEVEQFTKLIGGVLKSPDSKQNPFSDSGDMPRNG